jgi:hypothetical protein
MKHREKLEHKHGGNCRRARHLIKIKPLRGSIFVTLASQ